MHPMIFLLQATAADSAAVMQATRELLSGFAGMPTSVVEAFARLACTLPPIALVLLTRFPIFRMTSPLIHAWLDPLWERHKTWFVPVLVWAVGFLTSHGSLLVGLAAVGVHQTVTGFVRAMKPTVTPAGIAAARTVALLLVVGLFAAGPASAAATFTTPLVKPIGFWERVQAATSVGVGTRAERALGRWDYHSFVGVNVGAVWSDHLSPRVRVTRTLETAPRTSVEASVWWVW